MFCFKDCSFDRTLCNFLKPSKPSPGRNGATSVDPGREHLQRIEGCLQGRGTPGSRDWVRDSIHLLAPRSRGVGRLSDQTPHRPRGQANIWWPHEVRESEGTSDQSPSSSAGVGAVDTRAAAHGGFLLQVAHGDIFQQAAQVVCRIERRRRVIFKYHHHPLS